MISQLNLNFLFTMSRKFIKDKKAYFFSLDAFIALLIILGVIILIKPSSTQISENMNLQDDVLGVLSSLKIGEMNNSLVQGWISSGVINNTDQSVLQQLGEFFVLDRPKAEQLANDILNNLSLNENIGIYFNNQFIGGDDYASAPNVNKIWTARQIVSGVEEGSGTVGYSSRASLFSQNKIEYFYFGGYVGDGNITVDLGSGVTSAQIEGVFSDSFDLYVNDVLNQTYNPPFNTPYVINLQDGLFDPLGSDTISIRSTLGASPYLYIAGGYVKAVYNSTEALTSETKKKFPGIDGLINIYDSFYIPGTLKSMNASIHYDSPYEVFLTIGDQVVYRGNTTGEETVTLTDAFLSSILDYSSLSNKTIPYRLGLSNTTYNFSVDVFSVTDLSGSMAGQKITDTKEANKVLIDGIFDTPWNRVGLVGYETVARESDYHELSKDYDSLIDVIDNEWDANGYTCICCGINRAIRGFSENPGALTGSKLIAYYNFDNNVDDQSLNSYDGAINGNPSYTGTGIGGDALDFNGNDYVELPDIINTTEGSISIWIDPDDDEDMVIFDTSTSNRYFYVSLDGGHDLRFRFEDSAGIDYDNAEEPVDGMHNTGWHHIVAVWNFGDSPAAQIYLDGVMVDDDTNTPGSMPNFLTPYLGYSRSDYGTSDSDDYRGLIDEVRVYSNALSLSEIQGLYDSTPTCGNDIVEVGELCDGNAYSCQSGGLAGRIECNSSCDGFSLCNTTAFCGNGILNPGEECDDGNNESFDGCSSICDDEERFETIVVMSDGQAYPTYSGCVEQGVTADLNGDGISDGAADDAIQAARDACNAGISVFSVAFGAGADGDTLEAMTCGGGSFYYGNTTEIIQMYQEISDDIIIAASEQTVFSEGIYTKLYPDSYLYIDYDKHIPSQLVLTAETEIFGDDLIGELTVPAGETIYEANVVSYSGSLWTNYVEINDTTLWENIFNLSTYAEGDLHYLDLGDPYVVNIPDDKIDVGNNQVRVFLGKNKDEWNNGSGYGARNNKIIYSIIKSLPPYSQVRANADGCTWSLEFEDGTTSSVSIPADYSGSNTCFYNSTDCVNNYNNDAINEAVFYMLETLDFDSDCQIDVLFTEHDLSIDSFDVEGIPFMLEADAQVRVWR
ncbi:MAG: LamG-like jellyroll fold domain-containing protein [archaeon]